MNAKTTKGPELAIRFLRQGYIPAPKPEGFDEMNEDERKEWAYSVLQEKSDQELFEHMADFENTETEGYFDSAPCVEAIETPEGALLLSTTAWDAFSDPEYGENIVYENKNFAEFIGSLGFTQDEITNIAIKKNNRFHTTLDNLKMLDNAHSAALEAFRQEHGKQLVEKIINDADAPKLVKELIEKNKITHIGFEKKTFSEDYMPDHCVYVYLSGEALIGVRTEDQSYTYSEIDYTYGDFDIEDGDSFLLYVNDYDLIEREIGKDEAVQAYKYLTNIVDALESEDDTTFRDYLLERED